MAPHCDLILVVGSRSSSNTTRLREVGEIAGVPSHLIEGPDAIDPGWFEAVDTVGFTAGASAPERLIQDAIDRLRGFRSVTVKELDGIDEEVVFRLPPRLVEAMAS